MMIRKTLHVAATCALILATYSRADACTALTIPATISSGGDYCLTSSVVWNAPSYGSAIYVAPTTSNTSVTIDLGGYKIYCSAAGCPTANGVYSGNTNTNLIVKNGTLSGFHVGVYLYAGYSGQVTDVRFNYDNIGIYSDGAEGIAVIRKCTFHMASNYGIQLYNPGPVSIVDNEFLGSTGGTDSIYVNEDSQSNGVSIINNRFVGIIPLYVQALHGDLHSSLLFANNFGANSSNYICISNCAYLASVNNTLY